METIGIAFIGHLNNQQQTAGVGLSSTFVNVTCQSTLTGLNNAITVLVAISYGQRDLRKCEAILHRGRLLCAIAFVPQIFVMLSCGSFLRWIDIDEEVIAAAEQFTTWLIPAMFFHMQFDCYRQYLNAT